MRHRKYSFKIGRTSAHRKALLANQTCSLILASEIRTTIVKAKETRRVAEKMVTLAKKGTLHCRRRAISKLRDKDAVRILFNDIAPKYMERNGGYTRIIRLGQRQGDAAEMCILQWVEEALATQSNKKPVVTKIETEKPVEEKVVEEKPVEEKPTKEVAAE
jgi:large subunit ribosomal protein L17